MARTNPGLHDAPVHEPVLRQPIPGPTRAAYAELWIELQRQREVLFREMTLDGIQAAGSDLFSDPADQASVDQEQEWSLLAKARTRGKLRQVEMALDRMERRTYGLCVRCRREIPIARLRVQPTALQCAPCRALDEQNGRPGAILSYAR